MTNQNFAEIAKEITIAAIDKGLIAAIKSNENSKSKVTELNQHRSNEIAAFYKTIAKSVNETCSGDFSIKNEQE